METRDYEFALSVPLAHTDLCPASAAQLVQHAVCFLNETSFSNDAASSASIQATNRVNLLPNRLLRYVTPSRVGHLCDVFALFALTLIVLRT